MAKERSGKEIDDLTVAELRERASELEITGRSSMNKAELRQAVVDAEEQMAALDSRSKRGASEAKSAQKRTGTRKEREPAESDQQADSDSQAGDEASGEGVTAPSIGPHTKIEKKPPEERLAKHEQSDVDALGLDKRRGIVGGKYGPSAAKQLTMYGTALVVLVALAFGGKLAADELDKGPEVPEDKAPWSQAEAQQRPPAPIDFPRNPSP